jgi:hypothetical protein
LNIQPNLSLHPDFSPFFPVREKNLPALLIFKSETFESWGVFEQFIQRTTG